jgi:hypothetical protein
MTSDEVVKRLITAWLRSDISGCLFAKKFASESAGRLRLVVLSRALEDKELGGKLQVLLTDAADHKEAVILIFPDLRLDEDVARLIDLLAKHEAWSCREVKWKEHAREHILIAIEWCTPSGYQSVAMGLAPLGTMPVTRRSPFVSVALWPDGKQNHCNQHPRSRVSLADMPHSLDCPAHENMWKASEEKKREVVDTLAEGAARPTVSFCLRPEVRRLISALH